MEPSERASPFTELRAVMSEAVGLVTFGQVLLQGIGHFLFLGASMEQAAV